MFEAYFTMTGTPFSRSVPTNELLKTDVYDTLQSRLDYVAKTRSFGVFTGDAGTGKTTSIRKFSENLDRNKHHILYISDSALTPRNFYWEALHQLGHEPKFYRGDAKRQLHKALNGLVENERKTPVIIVDEAHLLNRDMLEEIRFLLNHQMDSYSGTALILVGQSELKETLKLQINEAIWQRVDIRFHLSALSLEETEAYLKRHLESVKAPGEIFTTTAKRILHEYSGGIPRKINKLATTCLMSAVSQKIHLIDDHLVRLVIANEFEV